MRRPARATVALALALALAVAAGAGCRSGEPVEGAAAHRVLIVSLPGVAWEDVEGGALPAVGAFAADAAVADLATRLGRQRTDLVSAYLTFGAGTRAVAPSVDASPTVYDGVVVDDGRLDDGAALDDVVALESDETYAGVPAAEIFERRFGEVPDGIVYLAVGAARDANERSVFGANVGSLGDELRRSGVRRAVIANGDEGGVPRHEPPADRAYRREAAIALMGSDGVVPEGAVSRQLLTDDPNAPFGRRLDPQAVLEAFDAVWASGPDDDRAAVIVEASDLSREAAYEARVTPSRADEMRRDALAASDQLFADLLARVDPERDAVLVVSPVAPAGAPQLGVVALRAPATAPGLLRSPTTGRDGIVQLADLAPTVLALLGEEMAEEVEGRAVAVSPDDDPDRTTALAEAADGADFRDRAVPLVVGTLGAVLILLLVAMALRRRLTPRARAALPVLAIGVLGAVAATFLVGAAGRAAASPVIYGLLVLAGAVLLAAVAVVAERRLAGAGILVALGALILVVGGGLVVGVPVQVNTVFGYSIAVAGRFTGLGNLAFALLGSAAVLAAALLADRFGRRGVRMALVLLALVILIEGLPILGADVGGVVAMVPAFGVTALVLLGRRVGWKEVVVLGLVTVATVLVFAFIDLARPADAQTHLARLAEHVLDGRWTRFFDSLSRRWQASFGGAERAAWATLGFALVAAAVYVVLVAVRRIGPDARPWVRDRPTVAAIAGLGLLAALGLVANDSSVAVPATMLIVVVPVVVYRAARQPTAESLT